MFDMSWGEIMVIGGVALIVIGPKDLPKALRTVGQMTTKVRRLAGEFQTQFSEAMREAELEDVKKEMEGLGRDLNSAASGASGFNPIQTIRDELKGAVESSTSHGGSTPIHGAEGSEAPGASPLGASSTSTEWPALPDEPPLPAIAAHPASDGWSEYGPEKPAASVEAPADPGTLNPGFIDPEARPPLPGDEGPRSAAAVPAQERPA